MRSLEKHTKIPRRLQARRFLIAPLLTTVAFAALLSAGCDSDGFDSGRDYGARETSRHRPGEQQFWVPLERPETKTKLPDLFSSPHDSLATDLANPADADLTHLKEAGVTEKMPDLGPKLDVDDRIAANFKYNSGYADPLLPLDALVTDPRRSERDGFGALSGNINTIGSTEPSASGSIVSARTANANASNEIQQRIIAPEGPLGEMLRQRKWRAINVTNPNPYARYESASGSSSDDGVAGILLSGTDDSQSLDITSSTP